MRNVESQNCRTPILFASAGQQLPCAAFFAGQLVIQFLQGIVCSRTRKDDISDTHWHAVNLRWFFSALLFESQLHSALGTPTLVRASFKLGLFSRIYCDHDTGNSEDF